MCCCSSGNVQTRRSVERVVLYLYLHLIFSNHMCCNYMITPDEDTRLECGNVGSWTIAFWSYVQNIFTNQSCVKIWVCCNYMITPDEDTRLECGNVGSWTVAFWSYVHKIFTNQSSVKIWVCYNYMITPDEDTRLECGNVGSWTVAFWSYVIKSFQTRVALRWVVNSSFLRLRS